MTNDTKKDPTPGKRDEDTPPLTEYAGKVEKDSPKDKQGENC